MMPRALCGSFAWFAVAVTSMAIGCSPDAGSDDRTLYVGSSPDIVISQLYGGGGNSGAEFTDDFVELFNRSSTAVSIDGWSLQYAAAAGTSWAKANLTGTIPAGGYYLVQLAAGTATTAAALPTPDATGTMNMSGTSGTVALVINQTLLSCGNTTACLPNTNIHDFVGYGTAVQFEGTGAAPTLSNSTAGLRGAHGCTDTNVNAADFTVASPAPRNSATATAACGIVTTDAGVADSATDSGTVTGTGDGTPMRRTCTSSFGSAMTATHGRLDGFLVAIVNPGTTTCAGDSGHVHLQVLVGTAVENIAVNVESNSGNPDVDFLTINHALVGGAWSEGWHPGLPLDFPTSLGVTSGQFTERTITQLTTLVDNALANVNHISIFTTGFDATGGDLVHREGNNDDGALVINPLSASPEYLLFHFTTQTF